MLATLSGSLDQELLLRNEYLVTENRILKNQIQGRLKLTDPERFSLAEILILIAGHRFLTLHDYGLVHFGNRNVTAKRRPHSGPSLGFSA